MCRQFIPAAEECLMLTVQFFFLFQILLHLRLVFLTDSAGFLNCFLNRQNILFFFFFFLATLFQRFLHLLQFISHCRFFLMDTAEIFPCKAHFLFQRSISHLDLVQFLTVRSFLFLQFFQNFLLTVHQCFLFLLSGCGMFHFFPDG